MNKELHNKLSILKERYNVEGFIITGVFGSCARNEELLESDVDILYELNNTFYEKYKGFKAILRLEEIKSEIKSYIGREVDIADKNFLSETSKKYILPEVDYV